MTYVRTVADLAGRQHGTCSHWQLVGAGWSRARIVHATRGLRSVYDGVWVTGEAPVTDVQLWWAATLTAPWTTLADFSAARCWELRGRDGTAVVSVVRPGSSGPRHHGSLRVRYTGLAPDDVTRRHGFPITTPERTIIDLWPHLLPRDAARMLREGLRIGRTDVPRMLTAASRHARRRGVATLRPILAVYARLPLSRCRSDAEVEGLLILDAAGVPIPLVNERFAGEEADFCWPDRMLIIEIDGPHFHRDALEDARKTRVWTRAGYTVHRISSDVVYADPKQLLALTR